MADDSHLDTRYFVDGSVYNCPFCNRRHVSYYVIAKENFDWSDKKACISYIIACASCTKRSMHLTHQDLTLASIPSPPNQRRYRFAFDDDSDEGALLDQAFFYSVPTSFFALDDRIPNILRKLLTEAWGCQKSNFLTGGSVCARKIVYELGILSKAEGENYEERIKSLKQKHPEVDPAFFDTLLTIQQVTSTKVHENSYDGWEAKHLKTILVSLSEVLHEIYVVPALRADRRQKLLVMRDELIPNSHPVSPKNI